MTDGGRERYGQACREVVQAAKDRLTLADVWDLGPCHDQDPCPVRTARVRSPLRPDRKPSFSVFSQCRAFDDKSREGVKGGVWEFIRFARPELDEAGIARLLVERAGLHWPDRTLYLPEQRRAPLPNDGAQKPADGASEPAQSDVPPAPAPPPTPDAAAQARLLKEERLASARRAREQAEREERRRREVRGGPGVPAGPPRPWPQFVAERWAEGAAPEILDRYLPKLAAKRGWPVEWGEMIGALGVIGFPVETRYDVLGAAAKRFVAFRVEVPSMRRPGEAVLGPVGYHQKFFNVTTMESGWKFVPSMPRKRREWWSHFEEACAAEHEARGLEPEAAMVPPLPFVVGQVVRPRLLVILEGQWDALTMYGALGNLDPDGGLALPDVAVMGVRGAKGTAVLLAHWGAWLRAVRPVVWLLPDADEAAKLWVPPARALERRPGVAYFSEQLSWAGAARVVATPLRPTAGVGKDFNDYYRAARPQPQAMWQWMETLKLL